MIISLKPRKKWKHISIGKHENKREAFKCHKKSASRKHRGIFRTHLTQSVLLKQIFANSDISDIWQGSEYASETVQTTLKYKNPNHLFNIKEHFPEK